MPFRDYALQVVQTIISLLEPKGKKMDVSHKKRFKDEFGEEPGDRPPSLSRPDDYLAVFSGNIDDHFRIGMAGLLNFPFWVLWNRRHLTIFACPMEACPFYAAACASTPPSTPLTSSSHPHWVCEPSWEWRASPSGILTSYLPSRSSWWIRLMFSSCRTGSMCW